MDEMDHSHSKSANLMSRDGLKKQYIMEFQAFAGFNQTGELDEHTIKMMNMTRCGDIDKVGKKMTNHTDRHPRRSK